MSLQCKFKIQVTNYPNDQANQNTLLVNNLFIYALLVLTKLFSCLLLDCPPQFLTQFMASDWEFSNSEKAATQRCSRTSFFAENTTKFFKTTVLGISGIVHLWFFFITTCMLKYINVSVSVKSISKHLLEIKSFSKSDELSNLKYKHLRHQID